MSKSRRFFSLLTYLYNARGPVTREAVFRHLGEYYGEYDNDGGRQKFVRDLDELEGLGFRVHRRRTLVGGEDGYELDRDSLFLPPVSFQPEELAVIHLAAAAMAHDRDFPYALPLEWALAKLTFDEDPDVVGYRMEDAGLVLRHPLRREARGSGRRLGRLLQAMQRGKRIAFRYRARTTGQETEREAEPYGVYLHRGGWVLLAHDPARAGIRRFHVHRISDLKLLDEHSKRVAFEVPPDFQVRDHMETKPWRYPVHEPLRVELEVRAEFAWLMAREFDVPLEPRGEWTRFRVETSNADALVEWALGQGPKLRLVGPPQVRERLGAALDGILARYGEGP